MTEYRVQPPHDTQNTPVAGNETEQGHLLRAIIFDFDGVLVNSEPLILKVTQQMAAQEGWTISEEEYYRDYLALDDRGIVEHLYRTHGRAVEQARRDELVDWKERVYREIIRQGLPPLPGAAQFVQKVAAKFPLAIASGSLQAEIDHLLAKMGLREAFQVLATADDCEHSKPSPCVYLTALARLRRMPAFSENPLQAAQCLAIEDAPLGIEAAHAAGMKCLALAHSRSLEDLRQADWVSADFGGVDFEAIESALQ
jgi:beta-phosphoglucomutase